MVLMASWPTTTDDSGTGQTGTVLGATHFSAIKTSIEDQCHSSSNTTIKPKDITDEVVTARGSKSTLDIRLDVSLNNDGTLKDQSSTYATVDQVGTGLGGRNVVLNPDFRRWGNGLASAPDRWTVATVTIARDASAVLGTGSFAVELTRAGLDGYLVQTVAGNFPEFDAIKGQSFSVRVRCKASSANQARVTVTDGIGTTSSSYHAGDGVADDLTVTHVIDASATTLQIRLEIKTTNGAVLFGGVQGVFSASPPNAWQFGSEVPIPVESRINDFIGSPIYTSTGNVGAGEDVLCTFQFPETMDWNGRTARVTLFGNCANNGNVKTLKLYFGTLLIATLAPATGAAQSWRITANVIRKTAASQEIDAVCMSSNTNSVTNAQMLCRAINGAIDMTISPTFFQLTGEATANNDVTVEGGYAELLN